MEIRRIFEVFHQGRAAFVVRGFYHQLRFVTRLCIDTAWNIVTATNGCSGKGDDQYGQFLCWTS